MSQFKKGQTVYCCGFGNGVVKYINDDATHPVVVDFSLGVMYSYTMDGRVHENGPVCLYHAKPEIILPKWQPKEGEWCWFWDGDTDRTSAVLGKFLRITELGLYINHGGSAWQNCAPFNGELPEHLKEVQP
jgi:hypothetical protein